MRYEKRKNLFQQLRDYSGCLLILLLCSCTSVKFTSTVPGQPKAEYYSFSKLNNASFYSRIDTSIIYVYANDLVRTYQGGKTEKVFTYMYLLFKSNGVVLFSNDSRDEFNQTNIYTIGGQYCFYKVEGDEVQLELYDHNVKKFTIMYANILPDRVLFYKDKLRILGGGTSKQNMPFIKSTIKYTRLLKWPK